MKNHVIHSSEKQQRSFGFDDNKIIISSKKHSSFEALLAATEKSGILETIKTINVREVSEISYNEKDYGFTIHHTIGGKTKKQSITLDNVDQREPIVSSLASLKEFKKSVSEESKLQPLLLNLLVVVLIPAGTWIFRGMAIDAQNGEEYVATGRRSGLKNLLASAVEAIGPTGVVAIGAVGMLYMLYKTYNRYNNPASDVKYTKEQPTTV